MRDRERLEHILTVGAELQELIREEGITPADIRVDRTTQWLVSMPLILIGEDTNRISRDLERSYPDLPWEQVAGLRHRLVHDYIGIDWERIATIVFEDLPDYLEALQEVLNDQSDSE